MSDLEQLKNLLYITFKGTSSDQIKKAEQDLIKAASHPDFLSYLQEIMKDPSVDPQLRLSASTFVQTYVRTIVQGKGFTSESQQKIIELLVLMIREENLPLNAKQNVAKGLNIVLCFDKGNSIKLQLFELARTWILSDNNNQLIGTFVILQTVILATTNKDFLLNFFKSLNLPFCQVGSKFLGEISSSLQTISSLGESESIQVFSSTIEGLKVLNMWASVLKDLVNSIMDSKKHNLIMMILDNEALANLICHGICVTLGTPKQISDCLICTSGKDQFDYQANTLKSSLLKAYTRINKQMFAERSKFDLQSTHFFKLLAQALPIILKGLIIFCQQTPNFQDDLEDQSLAGIVIECLKFATICAEQSEFYSIFQECSRILLLEVVFPLMRTSVSEEESLRTNPEEFVKLALDTCDRQIMYSYKTAAAKLLETVCDNIDGFETIVSLLVLQIIGFSIKFESLDELDANFPNLINFKPTIFISKTERHTRIETCLVALSVLSYLTPKRPDIVSQIETLLQQHSSFFFSPQLGSNQFGNSSYFKAFSLFDKYSEVIKSRVCLMLGYYTDSVFQNDQSSFNILLNFLFSCLMLSDEEDQGIVYQSIDSLQNIYVDDGQAKIVNESVNGALQSILPLIVSTQFHQLFDIILHIFRQHSKTILKDNIVNCIRFLVNRIVEEINKVQDSSKQNNQLFVNKAWNIIREMSENIHIVPLYINDILEQLRPLLQYLQYPDKIEFDEDIVLLVGSFVKRQNDVHPICGDLLTCFPLIFQKQNNVFGQIFDTLNNVIIYGKKFLVANSTHLKMIIEMAYKAMFSDSDKSTDADKAEGATILQLIFQSLGDVLPEEMWKAIYQTAISRFQSPQKIKHSFVYGRTAGIFMSSFLANLPKAKQILADMSLLDIVLNQILNRLDIYKRIYDIKLFIMSMSSVMVNVTLEPLKVLQIFDCLISLMMKQKEIEQKLQKQKENKNNREANNSDNDDDKDEDDEDDYDDDDDEEIDDDDEEEGTDFNDPNYFDDFDSSVHQDKVMLKNLISPIQERDEFSAFKQSYLQMREQNISALQHLIQNLNTDKQNYLKQILSVQRVVVGDEQVLRVIRTFKRKTPNS